MEGKRKSAKREFRCAGSGIRGQYLHSEFCYQIVGHRGEHSCSCGGKLIKVLIVKKWGWGAEQGKKTHGKCLQREISVHPEEPLCIEEGCQILPGSS